jgi:hypothetical protein
MAKTSSKKHISAKYDVVMDGYYAGLNACSSRGNNGGGGFEESRPDDGEGFSQPPTQTEGIDWFAACNLAHTFLGLQTPCNELVNPDNTLKEQGNRVLLCFGGRTPSIT